MKILLILAALAGSASAQLFTSPAPVEKPRPQQFAEHLTQMIDAELKHRIAVHRDAFTSIWLNGSAGPTASEVFAALGTNAALVCAVADENLTHIDRLAKLIGKTRADFIPDAECIPPMSITVNSDGTVTLAAP